MNVIIAEDEINMARQAAARAAEAIVEALEKRGEARIIVATGASQFSFLKELTSTGGIDWTRVTGFHLDEYAGLPVSHPASFRNYLRQRFTGALPAPLRMFHEVDGEAPCLPEECRRLGSLLREGLIDVACVGIGENGHLAFNDPPADFETNDAYLVVELDEACRLQQVGEGWFASLEEVPEKALSMSVPQIMASRRIVCTVPDSRKADAVMNTIRGKVTRLCPASILQEHPDCSIFLDPAAAEKL